MSKMRTKAALKGYENLKVSIPTTGLDIQHALDRSPNSNGCKLAALADIALMKSNDLCEIQKLKSDSVTSDLVDSQQSPRDKHSPKIAKVTPKLVSPPKSPLKHSQTFTIVADSAKMHSTELKTKSFEAAFNISPKNRKRTQQPAGKKTGYKERKKKPKLSTKTNAKSSSTASVVDTTKPKDIYDFEDSHDSVENEIIPLTHTRPNKAEPVVNAESKQENSPTKKVTDDGDEDSSYSDRDDYYNFNSVSGSGTEDQEPTVEEEENSDRETTQTSVSSKAEKSAINSQKKCLIMGRIFKNAKKNTEPAIAVAETKEKVTKPLPKQQLDEIFDNLKNRSSTKSNKDEAKEPVTSTENTPSRSSNRATKIEKEEKKTESKLDLIDEQLEINDRVQKASVKSRKSREVANLEAEWGMSMEQIKDLIGVGKRKTQRRCATNRQKNFMETWSSDEYEEFHSTKDIIALIQEAEQKAQRAKARLEKQMAGANASTANESSEQKVEDTDSKASSLSTEKRDKSKENKKTKANAKPAEEIKIPAESSSKTIESVKPKTKKTTFATFQSEGESDFDEHWNKSAKRAKIRNRRRTIASREEFIEEKKPKSRPPKPKAPVKPPKTVVVEPVVERSPVRSPIERSPSRSLSPPPTPTPIFDFVERKRLEKPKTPEPIERESPNLTVKPIKKSSKGNKPMPRRKRIASEMHQLYYWSSSSDDEFGRIEPSENDDEDNSENHLEQHGWIVGDSHKKLVTLLAHAKGKKIEDCGVKETAHKRK